MTSAAFLAQLKTQLEQRFAADPDFANVAVHEVWTDDVEAPAVVLVRERIRIQAEYSAMGVRTEDVTIPGGIVAGGDTALEAEAAVDAIVREIEAELREHPPAVGEQTFKPEVSEFEWIPAVWDKGGILADALYRITYTADIDA